VFVGALTRAGVRVHVGVHVYVAQTTRRR
jgi:hypothetical protein